MTFFLKRMLKWKKELCNDEEFLFKFFDYIRKIEEIINIIKQNPEWRMNYMKLFMRDRLNFEQGRIEGELMGERKANFSTAKKMISAGLQIADIIKFTGLSPEDLRSIM